MKKSLILTIIVLIINIVNAQEMPGKVKEKIIRAVVKIEIPLKKTGKQPNGTGFLVSRPLKENPKSRQFFLVTNKHVVGDWNIADGNIVNYFREIHIFLYTKEKQEDKLFTKKVISLIDQSEKKISDKLKIHPNPKVDIAVLDITAEINEVNLASELDLVSFDTSFLLGFDKIYEGMEYGIGDQVFALGYPLGITSKNSSLPIAKSGYLASLPGEEFKVDFPCKNRENKNVNATVEGKLLIIDGLIVGGNSGGPVILPAGVRFKFDEKSGYKYSKGPQENLVIGIVSSTLGASGINVVYSSDYIKELIEEF
jgi:S1-C subfamily serine protease